MRRDKERHEISRDERSRKTRRRGAMKREKGKKRRERRDAKSGKKSNRKERTPRPSNDRWGKEWSKMRQKVLPLTTAGVGKRGKERYPSVASQIKGQERARQAGRRDSSPPQGQVPLPNRKERRETRKEKRKGRRGGGSTVKPLGPPGAQKGASMQLKLEGDKNKKRASRSIKMHKSLIHDGAIAGSPRIGRCDWLRPEAAAAGWMVVR